MSKSSNPLIEGLNTLRLAKKFTDVTLIVQGKSFKAHRVVLAACSDYFCAMFSDGMVESRKEEIPLMGVSARAIAAIIEFIYTSKLELTIENIDEMLAASTHVQMNQLVAACVEFLEMQLDLDNCRDIAVLADRYSQLPLKRKAFRYVCAHMKEFSKSPEFNNLRLEEMHFMLSSNFPVDLSEMELLKLTLRWCMHVNIADKLIGDLFANIRFNEIPPRDLNLLHRQMQQVLDMLANGMNHDDTSLRKLADYYTIIFLKCSQQVPLSDFKNWDNDTILNLRPGGVCNTRGMELALLKVGGFEVDGLTNKISYFMPSLNKWKDLTMIPHLEQCNYGTAVLGNELFVVGGSYDVCLKEYIHPFGFRYYPLSNQWDTIAPIQSDRCRFSLNAVGTEHLYAVGGIVELDNDIIDDLGQAASNVERYDATNNIWTYMPRLSENRSQHGGVVVGDKLYISGGISGSRVLSTFWCFDTKKLEWQQLPSMSTPRCDHVLVAIKNCIYACGGWYEDRSETRELVASIEVYNIDECAWNFVTTIPSSTFYTGIAALDDTIYFVGGLQSTEAIDRATSQTLTYSISNQKWQTEADWNSPKDVWELTCTAMYLPKPCDTN